MKNRMVLGFFLICFSPISQAQNRFDELIRFANQTALQMEASIDSVSEEIEKSRQALDPFLTQWNVSNANAQDMLELLKSIDQSWTTSNALIAKFSNWSFWLPAGAALGVGISVPIGFFLICICALHRHHLNGARREYEQALVVN